MSYLGLHIGSADRPRFSEYLDAGLACVMSVDQNVQAEVKSKSPSTVTFWRTQKNPAAGKGGGDNPPGFMDIPLTQMKTTAQIWMAGLYPIWLLNKHDVLVVNNEQDIGTQEHGEKLNEFFLECMRIGETWGAKIGIASFSTGNPSDDGGLTCEQRWHTMLPAIEHAASQHYLILHAHTYPQLAHFGDTGFRHERAIRYFAQNGIKPQRRWIMLGEWSNGAGGVEPNVVEYMSNVAAWDTYALHSPYSSQLVGAALYGFNAAETLDSATTRLLTWIRANPGVVVAPPPPPDPEPEPAPKPLPSVHFTVAPGYRYEIIHTGEKVIKLSVPNGAKVSVS